MSGALYVLGTYVDTYLNSHFILQRYTDYTMAMRSWTRYSATSGAAVQSTETYPTCLTIDPTSGDVIIGTSTRGTSVIKYQVSLSTFSTLPAPPTPPTPYVPALTLSQISQVLPAGCSAAVMATSTLTIDSRSLPVCQSNLQVTLQPTSLLEAMYSPIVSFSIMIPGPCPVGSNVVVQLSTQSSGIWFQQSWNAQQHDVLSAGSNLPSLPCSSSIATIVTIPIRANHQIVPPMATSQLTFQANEYSGLGLSLEISNVNIYQVPVSVSYMFRYSAAGTLVHSLTLPPLAAGTGSMWLASCSTGTSETYAVVLSPVSTSSMVSSVIYSVSWTSLTATTALSLVSKATYDQQPSLFTHVSVPDNLVDAFTSAGVESDFSKVGGAQGLLAADYAKAYSAAFFAYLDPSSNTLVRNRALLGTIFTTAVRSLSLSLSHSTTACCLLCANLVASYKIAVDRYGSLAFVAFAQGDGTWQGNLLTSTQAYIGLTTCMKTPIALLL